MPKAMKATSVNFPQWWVTIFNRPLDAEFKIAIRSFPFLFTRLYFKLQNFYEPYGLSYGSVPTSKK